MKFTSHFNTSNLAVVQPSKRLNNKVPPIVIVSISWLALLIFFAVFPGILPFPDPTKSDYGAIAAPPFSPGHILGTDEIGRDIAARIVVGTQVSLTAGIGAVVVAVAIGSVIGVLAGYFGGVVDRILSAVIDVLLAFPSIVALIALGLLLGPGLGTVIIGIGIISAPALARVARASTLQFVNRDFVQAARASGSGSLRILIREVVPNIVAPIMAYATILMAVAIVAEASLSFLGLGVPPPQSSWGSMMGTGRSELTEAPHIVLIPALFMFLTLLSLNFVAEYLSKKLDVREMAL